MILTLHTQPEVLLEAEALIPERFDAMTGLQIAKTSLLHGNQNAPLGDFFRIEGKPDGELRIVGDASRVKRIGAGMARGGIVLEGNVGMHHDLGAGMSGGEIRSSQATFPAHGLAL